MASPKRHPAWGSKAGVARRAHAIRLLGTLLNICRQLRRLQTDPAARAAGREIERRLAELQEEYQP
jgi:hypothetical protein